MEEEDGQHLAEQTDLQDQNHNELLGRENETEPARKH